MANSNEKPLFENGKSLLGDTGNSLGHFQVTPKFHPDSANTARMARFFIPETLATRVKEMYNLQDSDPLLYALRHDGYFEFLLQNISDSSNDRYQIVETMGNDYVVFGRGESPEILSCSGILKNTHEDDWKVKFLQFFKNIGGVHALSKLYRNDVKNFLTFKYDSNYKRGAILGVNHNLHSSSETDIAFSFTFLVTKTIPFSQTRSLTNINSDGQTEIDILNGANISPKTISQSGIIAYNSGNINSKKTSPAIETKKALATSVAGTTNAKS